MLCMVVVKPVHCISSIAPERGNTWTNQLRNSCAEEPGVNAACA